MGILQKAIRGTINNLKEYGFNQFEHDFIKHFYGDGLKSTSGVAVNEDNAMKFSAVHACVKIISEDIGMLPIEIRKWRDPKNRSKGSDIAYDLPLCDIMLYEPNTEQHSMTFGETMQSHILLSGNGYAYKEINNRGQVVGLKLLNWYNMLTERDRSTGEIVYRFRHEHGNYNFKREEIFHIPGLGYDGVVGYSPIRLAMEAIGLGLASEQFASYFFANGANVGGFIKTPNKIKDKQALQEEFEKKFSGLGKAHKVLFLEEGMEFQKLVMPLREAQFIEGRKFQLEEIARIYRMPLHMIQSMDKATFNNIEHQDLAYVKRTMLPWVRRWELGIDTRLLTKRDRMLGYFSRFNIDEWLRGDSKTRAEVNHIKRQDGVISANEWRADDNQNPRNEPEADRLIINGNMRDISIVNSQDPAGGGDPTSA